MEGINNNRFHGLENFRSTHNKKNTDNKQSKKVQIAENDPYMKWPVRGLAYSNEIGEIIRPMSGLVANILWAPAIGYIAADVADKYKHNPEGKDEPSKRRATKQLSFQMLASVILPTVAVKAGQKLTNIISAKGKDKLSLNVRESLTNMITCSMNKGSHEDFVNAATGKVDRKAYTQHLMESVEEVVKHRKTEKEMTSTFKKVTNFFKNPFSTKPKKENVEKYITKTIDSIMDTRESLLAGKQPKNVSKKLFTAFEQVAKGKNAEQTKSAAFNVIQKIQAQKLFKNNALKSLGGLIALAVMMKPIDNFVEHTLIEKYIGPSIDKLGSNKPWKSLSDKVQDAA